MKRRQTPLTEHPSNIDVSQRDRLELIRFPTADAQLQAIRVLLDYGMLNFTSYREEEWYVRTPIARRLRESGVPFEWLTEHA